MTEEVVFVPTPFDEAFVSILGGQDVIVDFFLLLFWSTVVQKRGGEVVVRGGASTVWGGTFDFLPSFSVDLVLRYERCHSFCSACGFFQHDGDACEKKLEREMVEVLGSKVSVDRDATMVWLATVLSRLTVGTTMLSVVAPVVVGSLPVIGKVGADRGAGWR
ncbi:hypothetical protein ACLB2K_016757 [Fragaria x ananassa]